MIAAKYSSRYKKIDRVAVYPAEFVVRAFLGSYPGLRMPKEGYRGERILDLGYGDGRNMPLLRDLGFKIHGIEIASEINRLAQKRLKKLGISAVLSEGSNAHIPYDDGYFRFVLACHSCYYVEPGDTFIRNLAEIARVLEPRGYFVASLPMKGSFILKDAKPLPGGHVEITKDPYKLRNGTIFRVFGSEGDIQGAFRPFFKDLSIGYCDDLFWGIRQKVWIVVCRRRPI